MKVSFVYFYGSAKPDPFFTSFFLLHPPVTHNAEFAIKNFNVGELLIMLPTLCGFGSDKTHSVSDNYK